MANKKKVVRTGAKKKTVGDKKSGVVAKKNEIKEEKVDIVEQAQLELKKLEEAGEMQAEAKSGIAWGTLIGGGLIGAAVMLLGLKVTGGDVGGAGSAKDLAAKLPDIITPLGGGMTLEAVGEPEKVGDVYRFTIKFSDVEEEFTSYITGDASTFFVDGINVAELMGEESGTEETASTTVTAETCEAVSKSEVPELAAYIVSDCPYGKQMQQVMLDAIEQAPELADYFKVRYFFDQINDDGTAMAMHGAEEGVENIRQICIREEQPDLYWDYVKCYAAGTASATCLEQTGVDSARVTSCIKTPARGPTFARADDALSSQHEVTGSPTLILNDSEKVSESGFGGRNANSLKSIVCCSGSNAFSFCDTALSTGTAAASGDC
jgi:hypothetical protein